MKNPLVAVTIGVLSVAVPCQSEPLKADNVLTVGRFSSHLAAPTFEQIHPLAQPITVQLLRHRVRTVGQAIHRLLSSSGYAQIHGRDPYSTALMQKPLPEVHRHLGPMPLATALKTLVGEPYDILVNEVRREICVELARTAQPTVMKPIAQAVSEAGSDRYTLTGASAEPIIARGVTVPAKAKPISTKGRTRQVVSWRSSHAAAE